MPTIVVNGVRIAYDLSGPVAAPALVLVHGSWGDRHTWDTATAELARGFRLLTYDRRGHGASEQPPGQGSVTEDIADLVALIDAFEMTPANVAGNSFGGSVALRAAARRPEAFATVSAHEPPLLSLLANNSATATTFAEAWRRLDTIVDRLRAGDIAGGARTFVDTVAFGPGGWDRMSPAARQGMIANAATFIDEWDDPDAYRLDACILANYAGPALLTQGERSPPLFGMIVDRVVAVMPRAERHEFANAGHVPHLSQPAAYIETLTTFIRQAT